MSSAGADLLQPPLSGGPPERQRFASALALLRNSDPSFAEASVLYPDDMGEWQAAVYLLTGCEEVSSAVGGAQARTRL